MPSYVFQCEHGHTVEEYRRLADFVDTISCTYRAGARGSICGLPAKVKILTPYISVFNPYIEHNLDKDPILIESKKQRDELCAKHGVTYDSAQFVRKPREKAAVEDLDYAVVKKAINEGRLPDGTPLERPVVDSQTLD